jgi:glutathione S-transferase
MRRTKRSVVRGSRFTGVNVIYHVATRPDWERARRDGQYTMSTVGRTLEQEGYIHASQASQVNGVLNKYYRGVTDELVVLVIDPDLVRAPIRYEEVPGADAPFPHIYGPLNADAVIAARPLRAGPDGEYTFAPEP